MLRYWVEKNELWKYRNLAIGGLTLILITGPKLGLGICRSWNRGVNQRNRWIFVDRRGVGLIGWKGGLDA